MGPNLHEHTSGMRQVQSQAEKGLDDMLRIKAAKRKRSTSALIRECVSARFHNGYGNPERSDNSLDRYRRDSPSRRLRHDSWKTGFVDSDFRIALQAHRDLQRTESTGIRHGDSGLQRRATTLSGGSQSYSLTRFGANEQRIGVAQASRKTVH